MMNCSLTTRTHNCFILSQSASGEQIVICQIIILKSTNMSTVGLIPESNLVINVRIFLIFFFFLMKL